MRKYQNKNDTKGAVFKEEVNTFRPMRPLKVACVLVA